MLTLVDPDCLHGVTGNITDHALLENSRTHRGRNLERWKKKIFVYKYHAVLLCNLQ